MKSASVGEIIRIIGAVLDIRFPGGQLPEIGDAVTVLGADGRSLTAEAAQQLGDDTVRCVALGATEGLRRGMRAVAAGGPLEVPVGPQTLGRIFPQMHSSSLSRSFSKIPGHHLRQFPGNGPLTGPVKL